MYYIELLARIKKHWYVINWRKKHLFNPKFNRHYRYVKIGKLISEDKILLSLCSALENKFIHKVESAITIIAITYSISEPTNYTIYTKTRKLRKFVKDTAGTLILYSWFGQLSGIAKLRRCFCDKLITILFLNLVFMKLVIIGNSKTNKHFWFFI